MKDNIPSGLKWKIKAHNHQIADTGDYDGCYELTNGQVSIFTKYDDDESLQKIVDAFNDSDCTDFYLDDSHLWQIKGLEYQLAELREKLQPPSSTSVQVEDKECKKREIINGIEEASSSLAMNDYAAKIKLLNAIDKIKKL